MVNTPYKALENKVNKMHPALQFLVFMGIFAGLWLGGNIIGVGVIMLLYGSSIINAIASANATVPHFITALWILQIISTTLPLFVAAMLFAQLVVNDVKDYIKPTLKISWLLPVLVVFISLASFPLIEYLSNLNQKMTLPPFLHWMRAFEDSAEKLTNAMLQMKTIWSMVFNVIFIGLLTAIVEEFMFRGCIQTIFKRWTKNTHVAIWITAILFSAFHMEFFGFLPRLMLGATFGYLVAWSGSIWPAVLAHFINNASDVIVTYLSQHNLISIKADDAHVFNNTWYIFSLIIFLLLFWVYRSIALKKPVPQ